MGIASLVPPVRIVGVVVLRLVEQTFDRNVCAGRAKELPPRPEHETPFAKMIVHCYSDRLALVFSTSRAKARNAVGFSLRMRLRFCCIQRRLPRG